MWQPIESAPEDGTSVLIFNPTVEEYEDKVYIAYWGRIGRDENDCNVYGWEGQPTHWMPLPDAPKGD